MKHRAFTIVEFIVVVMIIAILAAILLPTFNNDEGRAPRNICSSNLKQIGLGTLQYTQDYDDKYPPVANARAGYWAGSVQPYLKSWQIFQCPFDGTASPKTTDYFYNARLADVARGDLDLHASTILSGDGTGDSPTSYHLSQLPNAWRADENSPAWRHQKKANYLFTDAHVKAFRAEQITLGKPALGKPTFLAK